jgi:NADH-quinone oxidoreductase subunit L
VLPLIPLFPFLGFLVNATMGRRLPKAVSGGLACLVMIASFVVSALVVWQLAALPPDARLVQQTAYTCVYVDRLW